MDFNRLDFTDPQLLKDGEELFQQLIKKALTGENSKFEFLRCWSDRLVIKQYLVGVNTVLKLFKTVEETAYKTYIEQIKMNIQDVGVVLALKQFRQCRDYYKKEKQIAKDMLSEYRAYVFGGHIWDTLVGNIRKEKDLVDFRTLPISLF